MKYTPFFYLCDRSSRYTKKQEWGEIIKLIINEVNELKMSHEFDYGFTCSSTHFTALHWLAYHNDH
jgi:hypothetical protein